MGTIFEDTADNLIVQGAPLVDVIARAYGVKPYQVVGAPDWVYEAHLYDIEAVPPPAALIKADDAKMLRSLLADRFGLRMYRGTKKSPYRCSLQTWECSARWPREPFRIKLRFTRLAAASSIWCSWADPGPAS
jgi:hypothetical protein